MSDTAIRAEGLAKRYFLGASVRRHDTLRDVLAAGTRASLRAVRRPRASAARPARAEIWALHDVSFEARSGEALGIIGRNGAGKSTLLKVLSRITEPTSGRAEVHGRLGSLLEVGTGFHPELTGRDNIYLNGSILGMDRQHIRRHFDEIVEFAGVAAFIDTPVKRYSSGMYVRLAFAVAAHLEPEILVMDEVLAVGDASFQKKSLGKMKDVAREGRTVLFVSHDMAAVTRLCERALLLDAGRVIADGPTSRVISTYLHSGLRTTAVRSWTDPAGAPGNDVARLVSVRVCDENGRPSDALDIRRPLCVQLEFDVLAAGHVLVPNIHVHNDRGQAVFVAVDSDETWRRQPRPQGRFVSTAWIPGNFLAEGTLIVDAVVSTLDPVAIHVHERDAVAFQVVDTLDGDSARGDYAGPMPGVVRPLLRWTNEFTPRQAAQEAGIA